MVKGGIEKQAELLNNLLLSNNYASKLVSFPDVRLDEIDRDDILVIEGIHRVFLLRLIFRKKKNFSILFTHGSFYLWTDEGRHFIKSSGVPFPKLKRLFDLIFMKRILSKINLIVTLSEKESTDLRSLFGITSPYFFSLGNFSDEPDSTKYDVPKELETIKGKYLCYIGRLEKRKNPIALVKAAAIVDMPVVLAGQDQGELIRLENYCREKNFSKLIYLGIITKDLKLALISFCNFMVIPSFFEGLPTVALEAVKSGKQVILTKYSYMDPHPCVSSVEPTAEDIAREIKTMSVETSCKTGFKSNQLVLENLLNVIKRMYNNE